MEALVDGRVPPPPTEALELLLEQLEGAVGWSSSGRSGKSVSVRLAVCSSSLTIGQPPFLKVTGLLTWLISSLQGASRVTMVALTTCCNTHPIGHASPRVPAFGRSNAHRSSVYLSNVPKTLILGEWCVV